MALVSLLIALQSADVASLVRDLDHDEYAVRRKAFGELVKAGKSALPALHEAARTGPSLEVRDASGRIVDAILRQVREEFILRESTRPKNATCGGLAFLPPKESAVHTLELSALFPGCEILEGWYRCMHRVNLCGGSLMAGISRDDGEIFLIRKTMGLRKELTIGPAEVLSRYLKPVRTLDEALTAARVLTGRSDVPRAEERAGGWMVTFAARDRLPEAVVVFDGEGGLAP
jgi:hypothetical protein